MDIRYINPFVAAVKNVFHTMLNTDVHIGKPYVKTDSTTSSDVSGIIGFSGDAAGCVVISFPMEVACKAASVFANREVTSDHPDFADAIGEIANIIAGNAKKDFEGVQICISLPSVIIGEGHCVSKSNTSPRLVIPCDTSLGNFYVEVGMKVENLTPMAVG